MKRAKVSEFPVGTYVRLVGTSSPIWKRVRDERGLCVLRRMDGDRWINRYLAPGEQVERDDDFLDLLEDSFGA